MRFEWINPPRLPADLPVLHPNPILNALLVRQGIRTKAEATAFLDNRSRPAPDPAGFPNLQAAIDRIGLAIGRSERVGIFGDYDADGITATAILARALRSALGDPALVTTRLPLRSEGYGLNRAAIDEIAHTGATLLIAVDCGSSDPEHIDYALASGLEVVVLDHHQMSEPPSPDAIVVSAQLPGGEGFVDLCSAGVAYMVAVGLAREGFGVGGGNGDTEQDLLDLVALGSIADMVPLDRINRSLVRDGIARIRSGKRPGIVALARSAGLALATVDAESISFKIGPRLNAAGRMADPALALNLLLSTDVLDAANRATEIEKLNDRRRAESTKLLREAELTIAGDPSSLEQPVLVVRGKDWPSGLLGPVSSQLVERYGRPAIVLTDDGTVSHGSARSIPGFDIAGTLRSLADLLERSGGHDQAAGLAVRNENLPALKRRLVGEIDRLGLTTPLAPIATIDADLDLDQVTMETAELISRLEPFGTGNETPLFRIRNVGVRQWDTVGQDKRHLRIQFGTPSGGFKAVGFGMADRSREFLLNRRVDILARLKVDHWNGQARLDVHLHDFRPAD